MVSGSDTRTAERLRAYLTQPFHVAEAFTGRSGRDVSPEETVRDVRALLAGEQPGLTADNLYMTGSLCNARGHR